MTSPERFDRLESVRFQNGGGKLVLLREQWPRESDGTTGETTGMPLIEREKRPRDGSANTNLADMKLLLLLLLLYWNQIEIIPPVDISGIKGSGFSLKPSCLGGGV